MRMVQFKLPGTSRQLETERCQRGADAGPCRLGDALSELLALYPSTVEMEPVETAVVGTAKRFEGAPCEMATA